MEIERKFLLDQFEGATYKRVEIEQTYVSTNPVIRLRRAGGAFYLTVKGKGTLQREEFEMPLTEAQYARLLQKAETGAVKKTRHFVPLDDGHTAEVDVYHDALEALITAEVEFDSVGAAAAFAPPGWFGREVTDDARYANSSLAARQSPI